MNIALLALLAATAIEAAATSSRYTIRTSSESGAWLTAQLLTANTLAAMTLPALRWTAAATPLHLTSLAAIFVLDDLAQYWSHRASHRIGPWWAMHSAHHSSDRFNLLVALRASPGEAIPQTAFVLLELGIGIPLSALLAVRGASILYQHAMHIRCTIEWPSWLQKLIVTPQYHELHHASNEIYWDKNYAAVLPIWDRIFKTRTERSEPPRYGVR
jgi:sterol desaturase/sphingolipid hydroxylase (fatty acid hydroxylase superfamily)